MIGNPARTGLLLLLIASLPATLSGCASAADYPASTAGQLLVATPRLIDPHFAHTVVYVVAHDADGAFGLVINRAYGEEALETVLEAFGIGDAEVAGDIRLYYGGPVQGERGLVLHSTDYDGPSTLAIGHDLALSTGPDVLKALAAGSGPRQRLVLLGYAGWGPGQLDTEISREDWLLAPADRATIFAEDPAATWERVIKKAGLPM
jgi:putative transcriptional regulator